MSACSCAGSARPALDTGDDHDLHGHGRRGRQRPPRSARPVSSLAPLRWRPTTDRLARIEVTDRLALHRLHVRVPPQQHMCPVGGCRIQCDAVTCTCVPRDDTCPRRARRAGAARRSPRVVDRSWYASSSVAAESPPSTPRLRCPDRVEVLGVRRNIAGGANTVCRTHGIAGAFADDAWTSVERTPPLYPDVITLRPGADIDRLLDAHRHDTRMFGQGQLRRRRPRTRWPSRCCSTRSGSTSSRAFVVPPRGSTSPTNARSGRECGVDRRERRARHPPARR